MTMRWSEPPFRVYPPLPRRPRGIFGKFAHEKRLPARFTRKDRVFKTVNLKLVKLRCLQGGRATRAEEEPFLASLRVQDSEMRGINLQMSLVQAAEDKMLTKIILVKGLAAAGSWESPRLAPGEAADQVHPRKVNRQCEHRLSRCRLQLCLGPSHRFGDERRLDRDDLSPVSTTKS